MADIRKPIQIQTKGYGEDLEVLALCDDGTIWLGDYGPDTSESPYPLNFRWWKLPDIPAE